MENGVTKHGDAWSLQRPPPLPSGYEKHHIVFLEAVHLPLAELPFEYTMDKYLRTQPEEIAERIKPATIVISNIANVKPSDMDQAPHLQFLCVLATGMGWVDKDYCSKRGITVMHCPAANIDAVSEHFLALYFASRKRVTVIDQSVKTTPVGDPSSWMSTNSLAKQVWPQGPTLGCKQESLGIIGYGALGQRIETFCRALGFAEVLIAERRAASTIRPGRVAFDEVLARSTTLVLVCPREPSTINLIDEQELRSMRKDALVVNMARGGIVNEAALAKALKQGWIFGAATDVLDQEPGGPGTTPLLPDMSKGEEAVPNLVISSHVAWITTGTIKLLQTISRDVLTAFVEGRVYDPQLKACVVVHEGKIWK